ncbi:MAG: host attachment protein [Deltaproteobacteria bacterium]|nr:host attachment protein [Deltaproteobacteria bacterium]
MVTWILVAQRGLARLYTSRGPGARPQLVETIEHAEGRAKDRELVSDRGGRVFKMRSAARSAAERKVTPHDHVTEQWATELATLCEHGWGRDDFDFLILVAEPRFLGRLKSALGAKVAGRVVATLGKDLPLDLSEAELKAQLGSLIEPWRKALLKSAG